MSRKRTMAAPRAPQRILPLQRLFDEARRHHAAGDLHAAEQGYRRVLSMVPDHAKSLHLLGAIARQTGHLREAEELIHRSLAVEPNSADALSNLGNVLQSQGRFEEAAQCQRQALALDANHGNAANNLAGALVALGALDEAVAIYSALLRRMPEHAGLLHNLGTAYYQLNRFEESIACYRKALGFMPEFAKTHADLALALMKSGNLPEGFREYEWRWRCKMVESARRGFPVKRWQGESLEGCRILLHGEQGLGDSLQFLRYLPLLRARGARIVLELPRTLLRLCAGLADVETLMARGCDFPPLDCQCPLMSLPLHFGTTLETIPAVLPLAAPAEARQKAALLDWPSSGLRVGLVWSGNPSHINNRFRTLPPEVLTPLFGIKTAHYYSLQIDGSVQQLAQQPVVDLAPQISDMADTAALIEQMDLVVAVDTSVAHLAATLGKPVWMLLPANADWRWLVEGERSPWYPSLRLFRQSRLGDWQEPMARLTVALTALAGERGEV